MEIGQTEGVPGNSVVHVVEVTYRCEDFETALNFAKTHRHTPPQKPSLTFILKAGKMKSV